MGFPPGYFPPDYFDEDYFPPGFDAGIAGVCSATSAAGQCSATGATGAAQQVYSGGGDARGVPWQRRVEGAAQAVSTSSLASAAGALAVGGVAASVAASSTAVAVGQLELSGMASARSRGAAMRAHGYADDEIALLLAA